MFRLLRRMRRDERGQAMVIGAVAMLVLAVSVMASVSIGHGVYEKIKLQDAADAQAYSIAVKEARAYNFLAYTNRAMVVHYSAMLTVMSYVSHAVYLDQTIRSAASVLKYIPVIGAVFAAVEAALKFWKSAVEVVSRVLIPILTGLNVALWLAQEAMLYSTLLDLVTSDGNTVIQGTDPKAQVGVAMTHGTGGGNPGLSVLRAVTSTNYSNLKNFLHPLDDGPHSSGSVDLSDPTGTGTRSKLLRDNKLSDPDMAKYRLLMGNLANAVRRQWTAEGKGPVLIGRRWNLGLCLALFQVRIAKTADSQIKSFDEDFENNRKDQLYAADDIQIRVRPACFIGRWRTVFQLRFRAAADAQGGFHQEYGRRKTDDHHDWTGITPFVTSDPSFIRPWQYHFGYPCNVTVLSKDMGAVSGANNAPFQMKNLSESAFMKNVSGRIDAEGEIVGDGFLDMTWKYVGGYRMANGQLDDDADHFRQTTGGMMAIAVGRAVYHRPGEWKEEPNFFNPLWTARLAPVKTHWEDSAMRLMIREWDLSAGWFRNAFNY